MRKRNWLFGLILGAAALTTACADDSGRSTGINDVPTSYFLSCSSPASCTIDMSVNQTETLVMNMSFFNDNLESGVVAGTDLSAVQSGNAFFMMDGSSTASTIKTDESGFAKIVVTAGNAAGSGTITITADPSYEVDPITFTVNVLENVVTEPVREAQAITYEVKMRYTEDDKDKIQMGDVILFPGKTCSSILSDTPTVEEISNIAASDTKYSKSKSFMSQDMDNVSFVFKYEETSLINYAVFGRVLKNGDWVGYGCMDGMNSNNANILLNIQKIAAPVVEEPDEPIDEPIEDLDYDYKGTYVLTSSFNALSLLPMAEKPADGSAVMFKDMLAGDWIAFVLNLLSNPEKALPDILTQQVLPFLLKADWFSGLLEKIPGIGPTMAILLKTMNLDDLLETFGVKKIITDYLTQLTSHIPYWQEATGGVQIASQIAQNFTLYGDFQFVSSTLTEERLSSNNLHNYTAILYHNGSFDNCLLGKPFSKDKDGRLICSIDIATLDSLGAVSGRFDATFTEPVEDEVGSLDGRISNGAVDIAPHSLSLAYGKLIYAMIMQIIPAVVRTEGNVKLETLGDIIAYYSGLGLVNLYNKKHDGDQISGVYGCSAVGQVGVKLLIEALSDGDGNIKSWAKFLSFLLQPSTVAALCTVGVGTLNSFVNTQLNKLSVSDDRVSFASSDCDLKYKNGKVAFFGQDDYVWDTSGTSASDKRCDWKVSIGSKSVDGKFFAVRYKD